MALAEGLKRFWNTPTKAPMDSPPAPILNRGLTDGRIVPGQEMDMPGKTDEPKLLIVQSVADAPVKPWHAEVNCAIVNGWSSVLKAFSRMKPKVSATLKLDFTICVWVSATTWLPASSRCENPATDENA